MSMTVPRVSGGDALVRALVAHGTELVFGIPGTHNLGIYRHLAEHDVNHVTPRHEQGAGFAADGYARVTGKPGVCLTTSGPAVLNALTAVTQSYSDSIPVLLISPGMPLRHPGRATAPSTRSATRAPPWKPPSATPTASTASPRSRWPWRKRSPT
ncbi:hypothetical protein GCM10022267_77700 [Lentzea roselyniae]|uniref:Thiamine pyrophosphate enzyme N-terminal TPP-binding domain-containing protein n=1 Tax=Lentzea roselyniae TaxID=531940 RepID=A0ABP7C7Z3_9PSEU